MTQTFRACRTVHFPVVLLLVLALLLGLTHTAFSQPNESYVRIENRWRPDQQVNLETGTLAATPAQTGWWSADWIFEPAGDGVHVRIKNRHQGTYIHNQNGRLEAGAAQPDWKSAMWQPELAEGDFYRLKNLRTGEYLHIENGTLEIGKAAPGWQSAMWKLQGYVAAPTTRSEPAQASYDSNLY